MRREFLDPQQTLEIFKRRLESVDASGREIVLPTEMILLTSQPIELVPDPETREKLILEKLNALFRHARRTPFYSTRLPDEINYLQQLRELPFLTKEDIIEHQKEMCIPITRGKEFFRTSGTSGKYVENIRHPAELDPHFQRAARLFTYAVDDPENEVFLNLLFYGGRWSGGIGAHRILEFARLNFVPEGSLLSPEQVAKDWKETGVTGAFISPPFFVDLTRQLEKEGLLEELPLLRRIFFLGEPFTSSQREYVTGRTVHPEAKIHSIYATTEAGMVGLQIFPDKSYHLIVPDAVIIEIINEEGNLCEPGEVGEIVVTSFNRLTQPLIRYKTGDMGAIFPVEIIAAETGLYTVGLQLEGRIGNFVKINRRFIDVEKAAKDLCRLLFDMPLLNYQVRVTMGKEGRTKLVFNLEVPNPNIISRIDSSKLKQVLGNILEVDSGWMEENLEVEIILISSGELPRAGVVGKVKHVIDERPTL